MTQPPLCYPHPARMNLREAFEYVFAASREEHEALELEYLRERMETAYERRRCELIAEILSLALQIKRGERLRSAA